MLKTHILKNYENKDLGIFVNISNSFLIVLISLNYIKQFSSFHRAIPNINLHPRNTLSTILLIHSPYSFLRLRIPYKST